MGPFADRQSFDRLVLEHLSAAQRFAVRLTGDADAAEELTQEALARAAAGWRTYGGRAPFRTWLLQIVVNTFRDRLRRRHVSGLQSVERPESAAADVPDRRAADPVEEAAAGELGRIVAGLVSSLPPRQREVLVLVAYEQLSIVETAAVLAVTQQNVRTNLHFAREWLRRQLAPYMDDGSGKAVEGRRGQSHHES